jgi:hypothetical protein
MSRIPTVLSPCGRRRAAHGVVTALAAFIFGLTGCSTTIVGSPVRAAGGPAPGAVDTSLLDVGNYPTKPAALGNAGSDAVGRIVEAQRMSNFVTGPWEVDPALIGHYVSSGLVVSAAKNLTMLSSDAVATIAEQHGFINGFHSSREDKDRKQLSNSVLRFPDPASATAAATEMVNSVLHASPDDTVLTGVAPVPIPGHPEALAASGSFQQVDSTLKWQVVKSFTPHGPYVLMQDAQTVVGGRDATAALVAATLDLQAPLIDQFTATAPADFATLPVDPTGLLARTLPIAARDAQIYQRADYQRRGILQLQGDPVKSAALFTDTGMDQAAVGKTIVYQARDPAAATKIVDEFAEEVKPSSKPADGVNGLPASRCMQLQPGGFYCLAAADRYAIEVDAGQLPDAKQQLAAQYLMLTAG